ncbi:MAG: HEAT repeat domain-containing protein, partial [Planctomycetota bacterium]
MSILALCFVVWAAPFDAAALSAEARAVREAAILQLAHDGPPTRQLTAYLRDENARVAIGVAQALRLRSDPRALLALAEAADRLEEERGLAMAEALVGVALDHEVPLRDLVVPHAPLLHRRVETALRREVYRHLGTLTRPQWDHAEDYRRLLAGGERTARVLREIILDGDRPERMRAHACWALVRVDGRGSRDTLLAVLQDPFPQVRWHASAALG